MFNKKVLVILILFILSFGNTHAGYQEIECNSDPSFEANMCGQCFDGGFKGQGDNISFLSDDWLNETPVKKVLFKEEQIMPTMVNLGGDKVIWTQTPSSDDFWEYTDEFNSIYDEENEGYVLEPGQRITWLKSKLSYAYRIDKNTVPEGENIGMLIYPITTHEILSNGELTVDGDEHRECVLYKSGTPSEEAVMPQEKPKRLPDTGPAEYALLLALALVLGFGFLQLKNRV